MSSGAHDPWVLLVETGPFNTQSPPYGAAMIAASLRLEGVETAFVDEAVVGDAWPSMVALLEGRPPPLFVGFSAKTTGFTRSALLARAVRSRIGGAPIVLGGIHATVLPERSLEEAAADVVAVGEAEHTVRAMAARLLAGADLGDVPGLVLRAADGGAVHTGPTRVPADLDGLPRPAWDVVGSFEAYARTPWQVLRRGRRVAPILTTRGCPFECTFCAVEAITGRTLRRRDPEAVAEEIAWLRADLGADELHVLDDVFNVNRRHAKAVCEAIVRRGAPIPFKTPNGLRADCVDRELVELMRRAGCWQVGFGVESADDGVLDLTKKRLDLGVLEEAISLFHSVGISVFGYFILGLPGDTHESCRRSLRRMRALPFDHVHVSYCIPYPGTEIFRAAGGVEAFGADWTRYGHQHAFPTSSIPPDDLRHLMRRGMTSFYARPDRAMTLVREASGGSFRSLLSLGVKYLGGAA